MRTTMIRALVLACAVAGASLAIDLLCTAFQQSAPISATGVSCSGARMLGTPEAS